jgi:AcrR family transcriptional regulator
LRGVSEPSLREVASPTGVSQAAPTHHFGDKEGLLATEFEGFRSLMAEGLAGLKGGMAKEQRRQGVMRPTSGSRGATLTAFLQALCASRRIHQTGRRDSPALRRRKYLADCCR